MSIFSRFKGGEKKASGNVEPQNNDWDSLKDVEFRNSTEAPENKSSEMTIEANPRQQRKILAAYAGTGEDFGAIIRESDVKMSDDVQAAIIDKVAQGNSYLPKREFLSQIATPAHYDGGAQNVISSFDDSREFKILSAVSGRGSGVDGVESFLATYPLPMDFEEESGKFLERIKRANGQEKYDVYKNTMESFKHKIYGKRYEYYSQMKLLDNKIDERRAQLRQESMEVAVDEPKRRKLLVGLVAEFNDIEELMSEDDVDVPEKLCDDILDHLASSKTNLRDRERLLLTYADGPTDYADGARKVVSSLSSHREYRILTEITGTPDGRVDEKSVEKFISMFPTPIDFEGASGRFLNDIEKINGVRKREQYEDAMLSFERKIYGNKYGYYEQLKIIENDISARIDGKNRQLGRAAEKSAEIEASHEWAPGDHSSIQVSRQQTIDGLVSLEALDQGLTADDYCEDTVFVKEDSQLYGVFDGAGGSADGRAASQTAAKVVREMSGQFELASGSSLASVLNNADEQVSATCASSYTTGVLARVSKRNGYDILSYASVGDSRIYIVDKKGKARMVTDDEGEGRYLANAIGHKRYEDEPCCQQFGDVYLNPGDRVVLCSDGITGDYGDDLMSEEELGKIVYNSKDANDAARNLTCAARKHDDRSVIVFAPDFNR